jgi:hypothetical protein
MASGRLQAGRVINTANLTGTAAIVGAMALGAGLRVYPILWTVLQRRRPSRRVGHNAVTEGVVEATG